MSRYNSEKAKEHYLKNRDRKLAYQKQYNAAHPEVGRETSAKWRKQHAAQHVVHQQSRRARVLNAEIGLVVSLDELTAFYGGWCMVSGCEDRDLTIDHVVPLTAGGVHCFSNFQVLCRKHNSAKGNRNTTDYRPFTVVSV